MSELPATKACIDGVVYAGNDDQVSLGEEPLVIAMRDELLARIAELEAELADTEKRRLATVADREGALIAKIKAEAALAERDRTIESLRVQHGDLYRCEGCGTTSDDRFDTWGRTSDDVDLCPKCWREFRDEARAEEGEVMKAR